MNRTVACFGISALALFSARASPAAAQVSAVAGCYDVDVGEWTVIRGRAADSLAVTTPGRIRLDTLLMYRQYDQYRLEPAPGAMPGIHTRNVWHFMSPDSLRLIWSTGYDVVSMEVEVRGDRLAGVAHAWGDGNTDTQSAPVTAERVACDAYLPPALRHRYSFPRGRPGSPPRCQPRYSRSSPQTPPPGLAPTEFAAVFAVKSANAAARADSRGVCRGIRGQVRKRRGPG